MARETLTLDLGPLQPDSSVRVVAHESGISLFVYEREDGGDEEECGAFLTVAKATELLAMIRRAIEHVEQVPS